MKRVNIELDEKLHTVAKIVSILKKKNLEQYLSEAVEESLKSDKIKELLK